MNKLMKYRRFVLTTIGILPLIFSLGYSQVVFAATSTSDISLILVADRSTVKTGQMITYTATMTNLGPDDAIFVDTHFSVPDQLTPVSLTCDRGISPDGPFCEYSTLAAGETVVSTFVATPATDAPNKKLKVTADVILEIDCTYDPNCTFDPHQRNNSATVTTKLAALTSDISLTLVADRSTVKAGQMITYTATMTNLGPDDAIFVDTHFSVPDQLTPVSVTCDRGISSDGPFFCEYSTLAAGETVVSTFVATPAPGAPTHNKQLKVTADVIFEIDCTYNFPDCTFDPHKRNNSDTVTTKLIGK